MGVGRIFSREGPIVDFPRVARKVLQGGLKWQKFISTTRNEEKNLFC